MSHIPSHHAAAAPTPVTLAGCTFADLKFDNADQPHRIFVYGPDKPAPPEGWPVLYVTDGNACFATAVDALKVQASYPNGTDVAEGVIVAIGYPTDEPYDPLRRSWDLSPRHTGCTDRRRGALPHADRNGAQALDSAAGADRPLAPVAFRPLVRRPIHALCAVQETGRLCSLDFGKSGDLLGGRRNPINGKRIP